MHFTACRRSLRQGKVSPVVVIITDVIIHQALQMALIEHDHMVQQVPAAVADPAFRDTILPRTSETGPFGLDAEALYGFDHLRIEAGTAIKDQVAGCGIIRKCLTQLLNDPGAGWVRAA